MTDRTSRNGRVKSLARGGICDTRVTQRGAKPSTYAGGAMSATPPWVASVQRDDATNDLLLRITADLVQVIDVLEARFLYLIREGARGALSPEGVAGELSLLARDLRRSFRRLPEIQERRDLSFKATRELQDIEQRCLWLFRKIRVQQASLRKLELEERFRRLVSSDAFHLYETLLDLDEEERESVLSNDEKIRSTILSEQE
jgi:hypothetical protein